MQRFLTSPLPVWKIRASQKFAKASAFFRHPLNSRKRKAYRAQRIEALELGKYILPGPGPDPIFGNLSRQGMHCGPQAPDRPSVSAIIPNYNHARFLEERIRSIIAQRLPISELIILDDASSDDSREVIRRIASTLQVPVVIAFNDINSGNIFSQWSEGISLAKSDLIWICESDDSCDPGFLQILAPYFDDPSVMLAFGRIEYIGADGDRLDEKNDHMDRSPFWSEPRTESAFAWFNGPFAARNIIANVGGCLFRRQEITPALLSDLTSYKICGDWFFYSRLARGGRIAYDPRALAFFRQHGANSSVASRKSETFYQEHIKIAHALRMHYGTAPDALERLLQNAWMQCASNLGASAARRFAGGSTLRDILAQKRTVSHTVLTMPPDASTQAKSTVAGQATELSSQGTDVSVLVHGPVAKANEMRTSFAQNIPIFCDEILASSGPKHFLQQFGVSSVQSHTRSMDGPLLSACTELGLPYAVEPLGTAEASAST